MITFNRGSYNQMAVTLSSNETLGILDSDYLEDYFGTDGQISLRHESGVRFPVIMAEVLGHPHEVFRGWVDLAPLPNGVYQIQGKVQDVLGNVGIIGAIANPVPGVLEILEFLLQPGVGVTIDIGPLTIQGVYAISVPRLRRAMVAVRANRAAFAGRNKHAIVVKESTHAIR